MANRFPLIVDSLNLNIKELPSGDNLDLTGSNIYNGTATLTLPTVTGTLATLAGTETLTNKTISSGTLSGTFAGDHTYSGTITLSATSSLTIPVGTTAQRPTAATGQIRFNSSLTSFEGYNGTAWSSLGGVKSVDGYTYIIAETSSGASNGELEFYTETAAGTAGAKQGGWNYTRLLTNTPIDFAGSTSGTTRVQATAAASGTLTLPAATDTLVGKATTDTLTNKTINLSSNTLTMTSAQLAAALSDETGSGANVFGTSPTITTSIVAGSASMDIFNTTATTVNAFGAATALSLGSATGTTTVNNNMVVTGNLTVNGTTTTVNSTTVQVDDITLELGTVATPTDVTANGGGIILKGATDKSITWSTTGWTSSEDFNLVTGKAFEINGTSVLNATTLGSGVTASSLTSVGTITTGVWNAGAVTSSGGVQGTTLTSTVATGTAPLTVTSTTKVANLNVEQVDGYHADTANTASTLVTRDASKFIYTSDHIFSGSTSGTTTLKASAAAGATTITMPAVTGTMVTTGDTGTVTNTMLAGSIANAKLANSTISGVALGSNLNALTISTGLSGTSYNGSAAVTIALAASGVTAGSYGGSTAIPVLTIDTYGRVTAASTTSVSTTISLTGTSGTGSVSGGGTLTFASGNGVTASVASSTVTVNTPQDVRTSAAPTFAGVTSTAGFTATSANPFHYNATTVAANVTIPTNYNAMSAGPITINDGVTVTVPDGSVWTIV